MSNVKIIYCGPCGFLGRAEQLKQELEEAKHKVELEEGDRGIFDIRRDGMLIFSRKKEGRFPDTNEIVEKLK